MDEHENNIRSSNVQREMAVYYDKIELVESKTFSILNLPEDTAVKGGENYETVERMNEHFLESQTKPYNKTDNSVNGRLTVDSESSLKKNTGSQSVTSTNDAYTNVHDFDLIDERNKSNQRATRTSDDPDADDPDADDPDASTPPVGQLLLCLERSLAQNAFGFSRIVGARDGGAVPSSDASPAVLTYLFAMALPARHAHLSARYAHWNSTAPSRLVAVAYGTVGQPGTTRGLDVGPTGNHAVAVWSTKNPLVPERFYDFGMDAVSCLKFYTEKPNRLAIGFHCGELLVIDVSSRDLEIIFQLSAKVVDLFLTIPCKSSQSHSYEALNICSSDGHVVCCRCEFKEKTIMQLSHNDDVLIKNIYDRKGCQQKPVQIAVTRSIGLDRHLYLVGTEDGWTYSCVYENFIRHNKSTARMHAHKSRIVSLEKSPYSQDAYLTAGRDGAVKIWVSDIFAMPVMTLRVFEHVVGATWSRTNPTIVVAITEDYRVYVWNVHESTDRPISVYETRRSDGGKCTGVEFAMDGRHLSVSDTSGRLFVYAWSDVLPAAAASASSRLRDDDVELLKDCIVKRLLDSQPKIVEGFCKIRPEYTNSYLSLKTSELSQS